jgi:hypothetical protein
MKRIVSLVLAVCLVGVAVAGSTGDKITKGLARSLDNIIASPAEITHNTITDVSEYSLVGLVTGPVKGAIFTVCRLTAGVADLLTLGLIPKESSPYCALMVEPAYLARCDCACAKKPCTLTAPKK